MIDLSVEIIDFDGSNVKFSLDKYNFDLKNDILIGSVEATCYFFKKCGIEEPKYLGYPKELKMFMHRKIQETTFSELEEKSPFKFPYFIKPSNHVKLFTGSLLKSEKDYKFMKEFYPEISSDTELYISEPINLISEYRCFVHKNELKGIQWYDGDFKEFPNSDIILEMIDAYKNVAPVSYTLDVGIYDDFDGLKMALVEVNDFWAIGSYGFNGKDYVRMTIDRFREIYKQNLIIENNNKTTNK